MTITTATTTRRRRTENRGRGRQDGTDEVYLRLRLESSPIVQDEVYEEALGALSWRKFFPRASRASHYGSHIFGVDECRVVFLVVVYAAVISWKTKPVTPTQRCKFRKSSWTLFDLDPSLITWLMKYWVKYYSSYGVLRSVSLLGIASYKTARYDMWWYERVRKGTARHEIVPAMNEWSTKSGLGVKNDYRKE